MRQVWRDRDRVNPAAALRSGIAWRIRKARYFGRRARVSIMRAANQRSIRGAGLVSALMRRVSQGGRLRMTAGVSLQSAELRLASLGCTVPTADEPPTPATLSVAVIVPTYDDSQFLAAALRSVQNQTWDHWRCYVVDDASPEDVGAVVAPFVESDDRFVYLRHGRNGGLSAARNTGLRLAEEDLVQFLDADDMLTPWALEKRVRVMSEHWHDRGVAGAFGQIVQCTEETALADVTSWTQSVRVELRDWSSSQGESPFNVHAPVVRTDLLFGLGGFDESVFNGAEDWNLWVRVLRHGYCFLPVHSIVGAYRQRAASMIRERSSVHLERADEEFRSAEWPALVDREFALAGAGVPLSRARDGSVRATRAARWVGLRVGQGMSVDEAFDGEIVDFLDRGAIPATRRRQLTEAARGGLVRGLGLSPHILWGLSADSATRLDALAAEIADAVIALVETPHTSGGGAAAGVCDLVRRVPAEVALVAETVADVQVLARAVEVLGDRAVVAVDVDYVKGDEGAHDAWVGTGIPVVPYNEFVFGRCRPKVVIARRPAGPVTIELLEAAGRWGGRGYFLGEPDRNLEVEESPAASVSIDAIDVADVLASLESAPDGSTHAVSRGWLGSDFPVRLVREESALDDGSYERLREMRDLHRGETAVIIGNGPSLNQTDLSLLAGHPTFGVNAIFLAGDLLPEPIWYYVVEDTSVFKENTDAIRAFKPRTKLLPTIYRDSYVSDPGDDVIWFRMNMGFYGRSTGTLCHPRFSLDAPQRVYCGQSVTIINLQLAHWFGFQRVVLIGMDFSYTIPADADRSGNIITSNSDDPNHFHPDYFGKGKTWKDPKLNRVLLNYRLAHDIYEATGREIINATVGGNLDLFPRSDLATALR